MGPVKAVRGHAGQRRVGAALSYVALLVNAVVSFVYVPILLGAITTSEYGVYELIGSVIAYLGVMDMGLSTTLSRFFVSTRETRGNAGLPGLLGMSAKVYGVLTLLALVACGAIYFCLDPVLGGSFSPDELALAKSMMWPVTLNCLVVLPGNWFLAIINALEDFVFARTVSIIKYLGQVAVVIIVLSWHAGAMGVLACQVGANAVGVFCYALRAHRALEALDARPDLRAWDGRLARALFSFSFFILLNMVFDQVFWKTGQVVLGAVCGAAAVAVYGVVCKMITVGYMQISTGVTSVFLPRLTSLAARGDLGEIDGLFVRIGRIQALLVWGVCFGFVALGRQFVCLWAGPGFSEAYAATVVLMVGLSVSLVQNLGLSILQAENKMAFRATVYTVLAAIDVILSISASQSFGVIGCAVVAAVLLFIGTGPIMNWYYQARVHLDIRRFWKRVLPLAVPPSIACAMTMGIFFASSAPVTWAVFLAGCAVFVLVDGAIYRAFFMSSYEIGLVRDIWSKASHLMMRRGRG